MDHGLAGIGQQVREKLPGYAANDRIDDPREHERNGAAELHGLYLNISPAAALLHVPPGAELPEIAV